MSFVLVGSGAHAVPVRRASDACAGCKCGSASLPSFLLQPTGNHTHLLSADVSKSTPRCAIATFIGHAPAGMMSALAPSTRRAKCQRASARVNHTLTRPPSHHNPLIIAMVEQSLHALPMMMMRLPSFLPFSSACFCPTAVMAQLCRISSSAPIRATQLHHMLHLF